MSLTRVETRPAAIAGLVPLSPRLYLLVRSIGLCSWRSVKAGLDQQASLAGKRLQPQVGQLHERNEQVLLGTVVAALLHRLVQ